MEQYFVNFGPQHTALLRETKVAGDPSFTIPRLGQHYSEKWGDEDPATRLGDDRPRIGDVTARLLAALIVSDADAAAAKKPKRRPDPEALKKAKADEAAAAAAGTGHVPFSRELQHQIDERLKQVLGSAALQPLGPAVLPPLDGREDDEICESIRSLQQQLKQQIKANNAMKAELRPLVERRAEMQAKEEETKREWANVLARYEALVSTKKKK